MASTARWALSTGGLISLMTTSLNAIASSSLSVVSTVIVDNSSQLDTYADFEFQVAYTSAAAAPGGYLAVYCVQSVDGTNYATLSTLGGSHALLAAVAVSTVTSTQRLVARNVLLPPTLFKVQVYNGATVQTASSDSNGNTLKMLPYNAVVA